MMIKDGEKVSITHLQWIETVTGLSLTQILNKKILILYFGTDTIVTIMFLQWIHISNVEIVVGNCQPLVSLVEDVF